MHLGKSKETLDVTMGGISETDSLGDNETRPNQSSSDSFSAQNKEGTVEISNQFQTPIQTGLVSAERPMTASGWLGGWLGRPTVEAATIPDKLDTTKTSKGTPVTQQQPSAAEPPTMAVADEEASKIHAKPSALTSWFGLWSTVAPSTVEGPKEMVPVTIEEGGPDVVMEDAPPTKRRSNS